MSIDLDTPIQFLKGVGPALGERLKRKGIYNINDLVEFIPRGYEDQRLGRKIANLEPGETVKLKAKVLKHRQFSVRGGRRKIYELLIFDETGSIVCKFFRLPFRGYFNNFEPHTEIYVTGQVTRYGGRTEFHHPDIEIIKQSTPAEDQENSKEKAARENSLIPLYSETEGLTQKKIRSLLKSAFERLSLAEKDLEASEEKLLAYDPLPSWLIEELKLPSRKDSLRAVHYPELQENYNYHEFKTPYHYRLIFDEFFEMEVLCAYKKYHRKEEKGVAMTQVSVRQEGFTKSLGFEYTGAQKRAIASIISDLQSESPMHRLIQGDVGCGKTLVAFASALYAMDNGFQVAMMAPTEILAEQHFQNAKRQLEPLGVKLGFLSGSMKAKEKNEVLAALANGEIDFCVGTHALIEDNVVFKSLGFVIIDEQHRFGVAQRQRLKIKGQCPHFLVMTATPIPRTLSMSVYGDLDVTVIDEMPPGRSPVETKVVYPKQKVQSMNFLAQELKKGRQAYIVYPLIEESETLDLKNATEEYEKIKDAFSQYQVGLLHGRMKAAEKESVMQAFKNNELQILVSTTVIEVGVDVPNANVMMIEHCERFGLSQLHQLRGRVGRGKFQSYCFLGLGDAFSKLAAERAKIMADNHDGFKISEYDLEIRGPGEFLGSKQSGLPVFKFANIVQHYRLLELARNKAFEIFKADPHLSEAKHQKVKALLKKNMYKLDLAEVG